MAADVRPVAAAVLDLVGLANWSEFVSAHGREEGFLQTAAWIRIEAAANGAEHRVIEVHDDAQAIRAGALMTSTRPRRLSRLPRSPDIVIACSDGPVFSPGDTPGLREVLARVEATAASIGATSVRMRGLPPAGGRSDTPEVVGVFTDMGYEVRPWATSLVTLDDDSAMLARLKPAARKAIRRANEAEVIVERCSTRESFMRQFVLPYAKWTGRDEAFVRQAEAMWDADDGPAYHYFVALLTGRPIATLGTYRWAGVATEVMSGRAPDAPPAVPAQDAIHWHAFRTHRDLGDQIFDLAGYNPEPASVKEQGIQRFKRKWGGDEVRVAAFERLGRRRPLLRLRSG